MCLATGPVNWATGSGMASAYSSSRAVPARANPPTYLACSTLSMRCGWKSPNSIQNASGCAWTNASRMRRTSWSSSTRLMDPISVTRASSALPRPVATVKEAFSSTWRSCVCFESVLRNISGLPASSSAYATTLPTGNPLGSDSLIVLNTPKVWFRTMVRHSSATVGRVAFSFEGTVPLLCAAELMVILAHPLAPLQRSARTAMFDDLQLVARALVRSHVARWTREHSCPDSKDPREIAQVPARIATLLVAK
mmetsp:Transcript_1903/g.11612  ORF Transcript_1903/g.11612 Transcript_1903/m.11612 type:complete len:252 (-) Transcript_1903:1108-1863(-)